MEFCQRIVSTLFKFTIFFFLFLFLFFFFQVNFSSSIIVLGILFQNINQIYSRLKSQTRFHCRIIEIEKAMIDNEWFTRALPATVTSVLFLFTSSVISGLYCLEWVVTPRFNQILNVKLVSFRSVSYIHVLKTRVYLGNLIVYQVKSTFLNHSKP